MTSGGFIKLHRKMLEWGWYQDANTMRVFIHCLLRANHKSGEYKGLKIERGQFCTSVSVISKELRLSSKQVRTAFRHLQETNELAIKTANRYSLVTVNNYDFFQSCADDGANKTANKTASAGANKGQTKGKQRATNKNEKNKKNIKRGGAFDPEPLLMEKGFSPKIEEAIREWWRYKSERKEAYKETGWKKLLSQFQNKINVYGEQALVEALDRAISSGWKGWDFQSSFAKSAQEDSGEHYEEF